MIAWQFVVVLLGCAAALPGVIFYVMEAFANGLLCRVGLRAVQRHMSVSGCSHLLSAGQDSRVRHCCSK